jgi:hypothetical protein
MTIGRPGAGLSLRRSGSVADNWFHVRPLPIRHASRALTRLVLMTVVRPVIIRHTRLHGLARVVLFVVTVTADSARVAWGGQDQAPPDPPGGAIFARDTDGRATVRAIRLAEPLRVDGELNESVYGSTSPISDFLQTLPEENATATERTDAWVMFDATHIYVAARVWDSAPPDKWTANEMRRDTNQLRQNDHFGVAFDTFHDRRNGFFFYANPLGARADSYMTDESNNNADWNPV